MSWKPLLPRHHPALKVAEEITSAIRTADATEGALQTDAPPTTDAGLLFSLADDVWPGRSYLETAERALERAIKSAEASAENGTSMALFGGWTGAAWVLEFAARAQDNDPNEDFDEQLHEYLGVESPCRGEYDLIQGLAGVGAYALERVDKPFGALCVGRVVDLLDASALVREDGTGWFTPPERMTHWHRAESPTGDWNLGLAHGAPGPMVFLARAAIAPVAEETRRKASALLEGVVRFILAQKAREPDASGSYPSVIRDGVRMHGRIPAWCYGDLGVAASLLVAARAAGRSEWETEAVATARAVAGIHGAGAVIDAGLCHGAAGVAHLFNRMYQTTGDAILADAARRWIARTLELRTGEGIGGYQAWKADLAAPRTPDGRPAMQWATDAGFLEGSCGIALALIAAATDVEPAWDRLLLVSGATAA